jgi:hypothetical protein
MRLSLGGGKPMSRSSSRGSPADPQDGVAELFGWYEAGTVTVPSAGSAGRTICWPRPNGTGRE